MPRRRQGSTPMPTVKLSLGPHVVVRPRKDGSSRVLFAVQNDRPSGWPPSIRLPLDGRAVDLTDARDVAAVRADADVLRARLADERRGAMTPLHPAGTIPALVDAWQKSEHWQALKPRTRKYYALACRHVLAFSASLKDPHVAQVTPAAIRAWLESGLMAPGFAEHGRRTLSALLSRAVEAGLIETNPVAKLARGKRLRRAAKVTPTMWTSEDVATYAAEAVAMGWIGGAILVRTMWDCPARLYDVTMWRRADMDMGSGVIRYRTNKSDGAREAVAIVGRATLDLIRQGAGLWIVTRPDGTIYRECQDDDRLSEDFRRLRTRVVKAGGRWLVLRYLRHSSQTDALLHGATPQEIGVSSTHADETMLLDRYRLETEAQARKVALMRGIDAAPEPVTNAGLNGSTDKA